MPQDAPDDVADQASKWKAFKERERAYNHQAYLRRKQAQQQQQQHPQAVAVALNTRFEEMKQLFSDFEKRLKTVEDVVGIIYNRDDGAGSSDNSADSIYYSRQPIGRTRKRLRRNQ